TLSTPMCVMPRAPPPDSTRPILGRGLTGAAGMAGVASGAAAAVCAPVGSADRKVATHRRTTAALGTNRGLMLLACHGRQPAESRATDDAKSRARAVDSNVGDPRDYSGGKEPISPIWCRQPVATGSAQRSSATQDRRSPALMPRPAQRVTRR